MKVIAQFNIDSLKINNGFNLNNINLNIYENQINTIIGKNGSGKSTLLSIMTKYLKPKKNQLIIEQKDILDINYKKLSKLVSIAPQINNIYEDMLVYDYLELSRSPYANFLGFLNKEDKNKILEIAKTLKIEHLLYKKFNELSGGERQKIVLSSCLIQDTKIIIMDEPLTFLDLKNQLEIIELIQDLKNKYNKTIILVLHELEFAFNISDFISIIDNGTIVLSDKPINVLTNQNMKNYFNIDANFKLVDKKNKLIY